MIQYDHLNPVIDEAIALGWADGSVSLSLIKDTVLIFSTTFWHCQFKELNWIFRLVKLQTYGIPLFQFELTMSVPRPLTFYGMPIL